MPFHHDLVVHASSSSVLRSRGSTAELLASRMLGADTAQAAAAGGEPAARDGVIQQTRSRCRSSRTTMRRVRIMAAVRNNGFRCTTPSAACGAFATQAGPSVAVQAPRIALHREVCLQPCLLSQPRSCRCRRTLRCCWCAAGTTRTPCVQFVIRRVVAKGRRGRRGKGVSTGGEAVLRG